MIIHFKKLVAVLTLAAAFYGMCGCNSGITDYDREKPYLDSLKRDIIDARVYTDIDEKVLQERISLINTWYVKAADTTAEAAQKMTADFTGIKIVYQNYIDNSLLLSSSVKTLDESCKALDEKVKTQSISREEFKKEYARLKNDVAYNLEQLQRIAKPVYDLDLVWKRYEKQMTGIGR